MLEADFRIAVTVTFAFPAGTTPEQAQARLAQNGLTVALGLTPFIRQVDANIIPFGGESKVVV